METHGSASTRKPPVTFVVEYAPDSADEGLIEPPRFVSLGWLSRRSPKIRAGAEQVVRRTVADLESERRPVEVEIETS